LQEDNDNEELHTKCCRAVFIPGSILTLHTFIQWPRLWERILFNSMFDLTHLVVIGYCHLFLSFHILAVILVHFVIRIIW